MPLGKGFLGCFRVQQQGMGCKSVLSWHWDHYQSLSDVQLGSLAYSLKVKLMATYGFRKEILLRPTKQDQWTNASLNTLLQGKEFLP